MSSKEIRPHVGIFGRRNMGKSSLINSIFGQDISIVSEIAGTTTDPVKKIIEIPGLGPVVLIDTAGIDDDSLLGNKRIEKTKGIFASIDLGIIVTGDGTFDQFEIEIINELNKYEVNKLVVFTKADLFLPNPEIIENVKQKYQIPVVTYSCISKQNHELLILKIKDQIPETAWKQPSLLGGIVKEGEIVLLIVPIDTEAPEGRLILPQVQAIRDILDNDCIAVVVKERELDTFLTQSGIKPALVVTDSSVFLKADASIPKNIPLTGFSILLARHKGPFEKYLEGTPSISRLKKGSRVLMLESCTHHVSCDDIGRVKIPRWMDQFTGLQLEYDIVSGLDQLPRPIQEYQLIVQCGGCMITRKQMFNRLKPAIEAGIPITNYGMAIAYMQGVYHRAIKPFTNQEVENDYL